MSFEVTKEMAAELFQHPGRIIYGDTKARLELLQGFIDRHNLAPASAVEEVELTNEQAKAMRQVIGNARVEEESQAVAQCLRFMGLRIVQDAKPVMPFSRKTPPFNLPDDDGFCSVGGLAVDLGLYKSSDAKPVPYCKECAGAGSVTRVTGYGDDVTSCPSCRAAEKAAAKPVPADDTAERERDIRVDQLGKKVSDIMDDMEGLHARIVALESRNPEPETVAAERTFTEAEVREAMRLLKSDVAIRHIFDKLGIDLEANK